MLKSLLRNAARLAHPDFAFDGDDRCIRNLIMGAINEAYRAADEARLRECLAEYVATPHFISQLYKTVERGESNVLKPYLITFPGKVNEPFKSQTLLWTAVSFRHVAIVELILKTGANPNQLSDGYSPLSEAADIDRLDILRLLLAHGARVDIRDKDGSTALHWAMLNNCYTISETLLKAGADLRATDNKGRTPVDWLNRDSHHDPRFDDLLPRELSARQPPTEHERSLISLFLRSMWGFLLRWTKA